MEPAPHSLILPAVLSSLRPFQAYVRSGVKGFSQEDLNWLDLVMEEVLENIMRHAYPPGVEGRIEVRYRLDSPGAVTLEILDEGLEFDPASAATPDFTGSLQDRRIGGLGLHLVRNIAKSIDYRREDGRNVTTLRVRSRS
jgi:serine/threonine-protein kinase RsbW